MQKPFYISVKKVLTFTFIRKLNSLEIDRQEKLNAERFEAFIEEDHDIGKIADTRISITKVISFS